MSSMLHKLLLSPVPQVEGRGRVVRFGHEEPDIHLATGAMPERILSFLKRNQSPATGKEISIGIGSDKGRVIRVLHQLLKEKKVRCVKIDGCVTEYEVV